MSRFEQDPTAWANKRKAAMERAKMIREQRKAGNSEMTEEHTFKPTTNKRPSYLDKRPIDTLDVVAASSSSLNTNTDDIFERPLPGGSGQYNLPSPGSDALGKEVKKFDFQPTEQHQQYQQYEHRNNNQQYQQQYQQNNVIAPPTKLNREQQLEALEANFQSNQRGGNRGGGVKAGAYKSNFMQQYERNEQNRPPQQQQQQQQQQHTDQYNDMDDSQHQNNKNTQEESDNIFFNSLRGEDNNTNNRNNKPGWNDDTSMDAGFGGFPAAKSKSGLRPARKRNETTSNNNSGSGSGSKTHSRRSNGQKDTRPSWDDGTEVGSGYMAMNNSNSNSSLNNINGYDNGYSNEQGGNIPARRVDPRAQIYNKHNNSSNSNEYRPEWNNDVNNNNIIRSSYDSYANENFEEDDEPIDPGFVHHQQQQQQQQQRRNEHSNSNGGNNGDNGGSGSYMQEFEKEYSQRMNLNAPQESLKSPHLGNHNSHSRSQGAGTGTGTNRKQDIAKARARLGLLKSKMRNSDETGMTNYNATTTTTTNHSSNSNGMNPGRPNKTLMRSSSSDYIETSTSMTMSHRGMNQDGNNPNRNMGGMSDRGGENYNQPQQRNKSAPSRRNYDREKNIDPYYQESQQQYQQQRRQAPPPPSGPSQPRNNNGSNGGKYDLEKALAEEEARLASQGMAHVNMVQPASSASQSHSSHSSHSSQLQRQEQQYQEQEQYQQPSHSQYSEYSSTGMDGDGTNGVEEFASAPVNLTPCPDCGRKFNPTALQRHIKICKKVFINKRPTYDSSAARIVDPDQLKLKQESDRKLRLDKKKSRGGVRSHANTPVASSNSKEKWKAESQQFREAMRAARMASKAIANGTPLPPPTISQPDPSFIPCPHCGRTFNQKAGERHIPQCKNIRAKPKSLKKGAGGGGLKGGAQTLSAGRKGIQF